MKNKKRRNLRTLLKKNSRGKIIASIFALSIVVILTVISLISFVSSVEAVTVANPDLDAASLSLSLFKKPSATVTGNAIDDSGNTIATVTVKANEEVGIVNDYFYGANTGGEIGMSTSLENSKSELGHALKNLNINYIRLDLALNLISSIDNYNNYLFNKSNSNSESWYNKQQTLRYAYENGYKVLVIIDYMPFWLANITYCADNTMTCTPNNYTQWDNLINSALLNITNNHQYDSVLETEIWNEPYSQSYFLCNLSTNDERRYSEYNKLYNNTYQAIKSYNSSIPVFGPSVKQSSVYRNIFLDQFLANFTTQMDGVSIHPYSDDNYITKNVMNMYLNNLLINCKNYGANCSRIVISEWSMTDYTLKNTTTREIEYGANVALAYATVLNKIPLNTSMIFYKFTEEEPYGEYYPEYPSYWNMYTRSELLTAGESQYKPPYNVTKDFAHYHAGGNMIVNSSSNNNSIKSVASLNPQGIWHITVINTGKNNLNVNIDVSSTGVGAIKDLATGTIYPMSNGIANVGILTEYDVKHYEGLADYEVEEDTPASVGGSSLGKNKLVNVENLNINHNEFAAIETDTSKIIATSDIFTNTNTNTNNENNKEEKEEFYGPIQSEEAINEMDYKSRTGSLSLAVSKNSYLVILIILLASIICTALIITIIYRKKKREADKVKKLMDWVDKARELGYTPEKMKEMLAEYNWDNDLVEKVIGK